MAQRVGKLRWKPVTRTKSVCLDLRECLRMLFLQLRLQGTFGPSMDLSKNR